MYPQEDAVLFKSEQRGIFNTQKTIAAPQEFKRCNSFKNVEAEVEKFHRGFDRQ